MVTIPQAVETLIEATGLPRADVEYRARYLRDAGLLPKGKRGGGKSAAHLDASDLAALLISLIATPVQTKAVEVTKQLVDFRFAASFGQKGIGDRLINVVQKDFIEATGHKDWLPRKFGKAVSKLIELAGQDQTRKLVAQYIDGLEVSLIEKRLRVAIVLKEPKASVFEITSPEGGQFFPDKLKFKPARAHLYFGKNKKATGEGVRKDLERPTRFEMKASIGSGIFPILADLLAKDKEGAATK